MNSVDFKLFALPDRPVQLQLNCAMRRKYGTAEINHMSLQGGWHAVGFALFAWSCLLAGC